MTVLDCLKVGRANAVTRAELVNRTGRSDRANRDEIKRLRKAGIPIASTSKDSGYWLTEDAEEIAQFLREADSRAEEQQYPKLREYVAERKGMTTVHVRAHERRIRKTEVEGQVSL